VVATKILEAEGRLVSVPVFNKAGELTGHLTKPHPAVRLQRDAFARVKAFLSEFGLSPSSRNRLVVAPAEPQQDAHKTRFFRPAT
jgi:P27 family predicted phage terminase small subunit